MIGLWKQCKGDHSLTHGFRMLSDDLIWLGLLSESDSLYDTVCIYMRRQ